MSQVRWIVCYRDDEHGIDFPLASFATVQECESWVHQSDSPCGLFLKEQVQSGNIWLDTIALQIPMDRWEIGLCDGWGQPATEIIGPYYSEDAARGMAAQMNATWPYEKGRYTWAVFGEIDKKLGCVFVRTDR